MILAYVIDSHSVCTIYRISWYFENVKHVSAITSGSTKHSSAIPEYLALYYKTFISYNLTHQPC